MKPYDSCTVTFREKKLVAYSMFLRFGALVSHAKEKGLVLIVVEDEALIRIVIADALRDEGFTVHEAATPSEALILLEGTGPVDAIFTDIEMPGQMNGLLFARRVATKWPSITIVITSGRTFPHSSEMPAGAKFIAKPYGLADIVSLASSLRNKF